MFNARFRALMRRAIRSGTDEQLLSEDFGKIARAIEPRCKADVRNAHIRGGEQPRRRADAVLQEIVDGRSVQHLSKTAVAFALADSRGGGDL